jgi:hypothetical protein
MFRDHFSSPLYFQAMGFYFASSAPMIIEIGLPEKPQEIGL